MLQRRITQLPREGHLATDGTPAMRGLGGRKPEFWLPEPWGYQIKNMVENRGSKL